ncbi:ATP-binding protein [Fusobacterium sp.]|uniref:ATP-binding protein n=1 Tax=Fusobacterium sp. TaxID=68766 RepID=UPI0026192A96|nr:ATP-binding protein [Fusobacterium sp.]
MGNLIVRLLEIKINNLKNVKNGKIEFLNSDIKDTLKLKNGDISGIYGQNGSGKTTVINALSILKHILNEFQLNPELKSIITVGEKETVLTFKFYIETTKKYIAEYKVTLKEENEQIEIANEEIKYSVYNAGKWTRTNLLVEIPYNDEAIKPKSYFSDTFEKNNLIKILVAQGIAKKSRLSFLFGHENREYLKSNEDLIDIIKALEYYGKMNLFVVSNEDIGVITLNLLLPLRIKREYSCGNYPIKIDKNDTIRIEEEYFQIVKETIDEINIVLNEIIPNLSLDLKEQRREIIENKVEIIADVHSVRDGKPISFRYESEGIKRIISILGVLISAYKDPSVCLAVDEFDSGIFEYLLGEILEILAENIKGQLVFTSHNLRILEKISKDSIIFTTTNPENRYVKFKYAKPNNNLRDMYLREMIVKEQNEELYKETNQYDIKRAFYRAGVLNGKKTK